MKKKVELVLLPTESKSHLHLKGNGKLFTYVNSIKGTNKLMDSPKLSDHRVAQHLYITVSQDKELIKGGDWFIQIHQAVKSLVKCDNQNKDVVNTCQSKFLKAFKIIATTDPKLLKEHDDTVPYPKMRNTGIPQVQQSFLKEFVANPDGEFEVEYETMWKNKGRNGLQPFPDATTTDRRKVLKLNQDNTVNISSVEKSASCCGKAHMYGSECQKDCEYSSVEEKMYSRSKMLDLMDDYQDYLYKTNQPVLAMRDWVKENL